MKKTLIWLYLPILLLVLWLLLNDTLATEHIILGGILAIILSLLAPILRPIRSHPKKPITAIKLIIKVAIDISISNYNVGLLIIRGKRANNTPGFINIPLKITDPHGLAALSCIITFTPGTVWAGHDAEQNILTLHVLDIQDDAALVLHIQKHYERPLLEIFQ